MHLLKYHFLIASIMAVASFSIAGYRTLPPYNVSDCGDFPSLRVTLLVAFFFHFLCSVGDVIGFALHVSFSLFQLVSNHHGVCCISVCLKFSLSKP